MILLASLSEIFVLSALPTIFLIIVTAIKKTVTFLSPNRYRVIVKNERGDDKKARSIRQVDIIHN
jgi:fumarylacetoacetate (FAA) hydrolase family protein